MKIILSVSLAILVIISGYIAYRPRNNVQIGSTNRTGDTIGRDVNSNAVKRFRILNWNSGLSETVGIELEYKKNMWKVISRFDYPADKGARIGATLGSILGLTCGRLITTKKQEYSRFGVRDPQNASDFDGEGSGQRITLWDYKKKVILDLIIGKKADKFPGQYYVREASSNGVYTCKLDRESLTAKFTDWVERDLMKLSRDNIRVLVVDKHSVNEKRGTLVRGPITTFTRKDEKSAWGCTKLPEGKAIKKKAINYLVDNLASMRILDIEKRVASPFHMRARGFFTGNNQLYGNEGALRVITNNGIAYHIFFGEIDARSSVGKLNSTAKTSSPNRYIAIFLNYQKSFDSKLNDIYKKKDDGRQNQKSVPEHIAARTKLLENMNERFGKFYYIISNRVFKKLHPKTASFFKMESRSKKIQP